MDILSRSEATAWSGLRGRAASKRGAVALGASGPVRAWNVAIAVLLLVLAAPLMLLIAVLVRASSPGPIIYAQPRVGLDRRNGRGSDLDLSRRRVDHGGRLFQIYKFRTMYQNGNRHEPQAWARPDDPRITPVGRILRKYRLDELPQLFNVLRGDMSVVGPRPEQPAIFARLRSEIDGYERRQRVPPGITGLAQVKRPYDRSLEDVRKKLQHDLEYIERRSVAEDLKILARTIPVVVSKTGAW